MLLSLFWVNVARRTDPVRLVVWTLSIGRALFFLMPLVQNGACSWEWCSSTMRLPPWPR
jgi:hypothetical protein